MKEGWELKKLGEVCLTGAGGTPLKQHTEYYEGGKIPWLRSGEVCQKEIYNTELFITDLGLKNSSAKIFPANTVVIAMYGATAGQVGILKIKASTNQAVCGIFPDNNFIPEFLYYFFSFYEDKLAAQAVGGAQPNISQIKIKNTYIPVISLSEQQRIVEILDTAFAKIDTIKQNAERNLQNAKELFQSVLDQSFISSETYGVKKIIDILEKTETTNPLNKPNFFFKYIDVSSVSNKTFRIEETSTIIGKDAPSRARKLIKKDDVIFATVRPTLKRISVIPEEFNNEICSTGYCVLRPSEKTLTNWIFYFLQTTSFLSIMERLQRGASYPAVTDGDIKNQNIPVPPISEQQQIVSKLDALSAKCKELENNYLKTVNDCDELKKAILAKAFNGEL